MSFHICFFLFFVQFSLSIVKNKNKKSQKKKKRKKERRGATGRSCPGNQKKKIIIIGNVQTRKKKKIIIIIKKKEQAQYSIYRPNQKEKRKGRGNGLDKPMCKYTWVFSLFTYQIPPTQFSSYFEEKIFCWVQGENTWTLPSYQFFSLPSPDQTPTKKIFILIFSSKFSFLFSFQSFRFIKFLIIE